MVSKTLSTQTQRLNAGVDCSLSLSKKKKKNHETQQQILLLIFASLSTFFYAGGVYGWGHMQV